VPIFKEESENNIKPARASLAGFKVNLAGHGSTTKTQHLIIRFPDLDYHAIGVSAHRLKLGNNVFDFMGIVIGLLDKGLRLR